MKASELSAAVDKIKAIQEAKLLLETISSHTARAVISISFEGRHRWDIQSSILDEAIISSLGPLLDSKIAALTAELAAMGIEADS